jgi:hypothetical protein
VFDITIVGAIAGAAIAATLTVATTLEPTASKAIFLPTAMLVGVLGLLFGGAMVAFHVAQLSLGLLLNDVTPSEVAIKSRVAARIGNLVYYTDTCAAALILIFACAVSGLWIAAVRNRTSLTNLR